MKSNFQLKGPFIGCKLTYVYVQLQSLFIFYQITAAI